MQKYEADYTNTFISLTFQEVEDTALGRNVEFIKWHTKWRSRLNRQSQSKEAIQELMKKNNPAIIPRNHRVEEALESAEKGDLSVMNRLLDMLSKPYDHCPEQKEYAALPIPSSTPYRTFCGT